MIDTSKIRKWADNLSAGDPLRDVRLTMVRNAFGLACDILDELREIKATLTPTPAPLSRMPLPPWVKRAWRDSKPGGILPAADPRSGKDRRQIWAEHIDAPRRVGPPDRRGLAVSMIPEYDLTPDGKL